MKNYFLITGSTKGIGFEIARQLGKKGYPIILSGRNPDKLNLAIEKLNLESIHTDSILMDVSSETGILSAAANLASKGIKLDGLINNAGILVKEDHHLSKDQERIFMETFTTNALGPLRVIKAFLPLMNRPGRIINVSSGGGSMSDPVGGWSPAYCASKSFLNALSRQLAHELRSEKIAVNSITPGWVRTDMGGASAPRNVAKGAETPVWLASEADISLTGKFFEDKREIPW